VKLSLCNDVSLTEFLSLSVKRLASNGVPNIIRTSGLSYRRTAYLMLAGVHLCTGKLSCGDRCEISHCSCPIKGIK